jgi:hypothetical protein
VDKHSGRAIRVTESLLSLHSLRPPEAAAAEPPRRAQGWCVYRARKMTSAWSTVCFRCGAILEDVDRACAHSVAELILNSRGS